jgi:siroheme synthase-like protein
MISLSRRTLAPMSAPGYPIVLRLEGQPCLVIGGGTVAHRKIRGLVEAGADVTVIAPEVTAGITDLGVAILPRRYLHGDLAGYRIAVAATGDPAVDGAVFAEGEASGVLVNAADDAAHCRFTLPALIRRGAVAVAVSSDGTSPALSTWLRNRIDSALPDSLDELVALLAHARSTIRAAGVATEGLDWQRLIDALSAAVGSEPEPARALVDAFVSDALGTAGEARSDLGGTVTP